MCRDAVDPDHFYLIGEWADIETAKGIKLRDSLTVMHRRHAEMLPRATVSADDLQAAGITLRRLERFWIRAADLVPRPQQLAPVSSPPAQPLFA